MSTRKKIIIFIDWYLPGYKAGGPIRSVENIVKGLQQVADFYICTSNSDFQAELPYPNIRYNEWNTLTEHCKVMYLPKENQNISTYAKILKGESFDVVYINSAFSVNFALKPLFLLKKLNFSNKIIVAPRGMLGKGALQIKATKKKIFLAVSKIIGIYKNVTWHASSVKEEEEIQTIFGQNETIVVAPNLPSVRNNELRAVKKEIGKVKLFFLSRISEKKNLLGALKLVKGITKGDIEFDIYGPLEDDNYWNLCENEIKKTPKNVIVKYKGVLKPSEINTVISKCHFMLLPTLNENYGHVFVESFLAGKPIIISNQTPWNNLEQKNVGWDISLDNESKFIEVINECVKMTQDKYDKMSNKAFQYGKTIVEDKTVLQNNIDLFTKS